MGMNLYDLSSAELFRRTANLFDDFMATYASGGLWTTGGSGATVANSASAVGGVLSVATGATSTNEAWISNAAKPFTFLKNQPQYYEVFEQFTDTGTNNGEFFAGFSSAFATGLISSGALASSFSGAGFYKLTGQTTIHTVVSIGSTQVTHDTGVVANNAAYQTLSIVCRPSQNPASNLMEVVFLVNGQEPLDPTFYRPI